MVNSSSEHLGLCQFKFSHACLGCSSDSSCPSIRSLPVSHSLFSVTAPAAFINMQDPSLYRDAAPTHRATRYRPERLMASPPHSGSNSSPITTVSLFLQDIAPPDQLLQSCYNPSLPLLHTHSQGMSTQVRRSCVPTHSPAHVVYHTQNCHQGQEMYSHTTNRKHSFFLPFMHFLIIFLLLT